MEDNVIIDQSELAKDVATKIPYQFVDAFLVKPLDTIKVTKEFSKPVSDKPSTTDENGVDAIDYEKVETEVKEVDSDYRKGVVLKVPVSYVNMFDDGKFKPVRIEVGDVILFRDRAGVYFDLLKDSRMVRYFDIVAVEK